MVNKKTLLSIVIITSLLVLTQAADYVFKDPTSSDVALIHDNGNLSLTKGNVTADIGFFTTIGNLTNRVIHSYTQNLNVFSGLQVKTKLLYADTQNGFLGVNTLTPKNTLNVNGQMYLWGNRIVNVSDPIQNQDVATKKYVDSLSEGTTSLSFDFVVNAGKTVTAGKAVSLIGSGVENDGSAKVIGIAQQSKTAGQNVTVTVLGASNNHTGLSTGSTYYANADGSLTTSNTGTRVGLAISATTILIDSNLYNENQFFADMIFANDFRITEAQKYQGLIFKNQKGNEVLNINERGDLTLKGKLKTSQISINPSPIPESSKESTGEVGQVFYDDKYLYIKTWEGWKRARLE